MFVIMIITTTKQLGLTYIESQGFNLSLYLILNVPFEKPLHPDIVKEGEGGERKKRKKEKSKDKKKERERMNKRILENLIHPRYTFLTRNLVLSQQLPVL